MTATVRPLLPCAAGPPAGDASNTPSSSGKPCRHHIGKVATVGTPVSASSCSGAGANNEASPRNLLSTKPCSKARSASGISAQVPYRCAKAPPRSMSVTSKQRASACRATRRLTMSLDIRLISAGEPAPSITTTSFSSRNASSACAICGHTRSLRLRHGSAVSSALTCPISTTWLCVSRSGFSSKGLWRTSGCVRAARAWKYCALPISPPWSKPARPATTRALLLMFCALNGATLSPWRAYQRHRAVASQLLPAPLVVPRTMTLRAVTSVPPNSRLFAGPHASACRLSLTWRWQARQSGLSC